MIEEQRYSRLDFGFARFMAEHYRADGSHKARFEDLMRDLSAQQTAGHSCLQLSAEDQDIVMASGLASTQDFTPLIIDNQRLYLRRYWLYEQRLARQLAYLSQQNSPSPVDVILERYFPKTEEMDLQKQAAKSVCCQAITLITGGPGTGKTTTVVKILGLLQELSAYPLHIALAAPTGKAAMRLQASIVDNKQWLPCAQAIKDHIPDKVMTLHRLLGAKPPTPYFRHNADQPLPYDVVVIDESSMVDLALMSKLVDALKPGVRLILLGDKDQLASVESGAVLADLTCSLPGQTVELLKVHRFQGHIKILADAINRQQIDSAWQVLAENSNEIGLLTAEPIAWIVENYLHYLQLMADGADFVSIFAAFNRFKVLCANRHGRNAVADVNNRVEAELVRRGSINVTGVWYLGRPVMVTVNDPVLQVYNGDIGLCLPDAESGGQLKVFFMRADGSIKKVSLARLNRCETVFAMTIHKSQGSEFDQVLIMLPDQPNAVLSKELLYTAVTRAKKQIRVYAEESVFKACIVHSVQRQSGLAENIENYRATLSNNGSGCCQRTMIDAD